MPAPVIQFKRGAFANLPGLRAGEPGFTTDSYDLYVGLTSSTGTNKFFGSSRYWTRETTTVGSAVKVVEGSNNGSNFIALKSPDSLTQDYTYTLPSSYGTSGFVLQSDGAGGLTWVSASAAAGSIFGITVREEGAIVGSAGSVTSINFVGEGYTATAAGAGATITLNDATTSSKGIASFNATDFNVNSGVVGINTESIQDMIGSAINAGIDTNIAITYDDVNNRINANVNTASTTTLGVASFNSSFFSVNTGAVSIATNAIGLGTHTYGQYAKSIVGGNGLTATAANGDDATDYTINVNVGSGITITSDAVAFRNAASLTNNNGLKWDSVNGQLTNSIIADNGTTVTISGNLSVTGTLTGTASTATKATLVDTTSAPAGTFYPALFVNSTGTASTAVYVDSGISYVSNTDTLTLTGDLAINGGDLTSTATTFNLVNGNATTVNFAGAATQLLVGATSGVTTVRNSLRITSNLLDSTNSAGISGQLLTVTGTGIGWTTISGVSAGTISTAARANSVDILDTDAVTARVLFGSNGNGQSVYSDDEFTYNSSTNSIIVANAQHSAVKALDGTNAITISNTTGNVGIASDLTVTGNLYVAGSTTQINTASLQVEDRVIELGKVQGTAPSDTTWDLGILFNYYTASSNKKASVYWEHGSQRFLFASDVTESVLGINLPDSGAVGLGTTTPQLSSPTFAPIEVAALWVNDTAGSSAVVSYLPLNGLYTGSPADRYLQNVTVDGGTF